MATRGASRFHTSLCFALPEYIAKVLLGASAHGQRPTTLSHHESAAARVLAVELANGERVGVRLPVLSYRLLPLEPGASVRIAPRREGLALLGNSGPARLRATSGLPDLRGGE